jgi:C4-dicarboxylate transporter, DctM subunit
VLLDSYPLKLFTSLDNFGLLAIPLFILVGELMNGAGSPSGWCGWRRPSSARCRGGLAYINLLANMMVASILGSATAQIAMMSRVMVPEMERAGYERAFAAG